MLKRSQERKRLETKSLEKMKELSDIIKNSETDEIALSFLKESWVDDYPDLDLGREDLHIATKILSGDESGVKESDLEVKDGNLNEDFLSFFMKKKEKAKRRRKKRR